MLPTVDNLRNLFLTARCLSSSEERFSGNASLSLGAYITQLNGETAARSRPTTCCVRTQQVLSELLPRFVVVRKIHFGIKLERENSQRGYYESFKMILRVVATTKARRAKGSLQFSMTTPPSFQEVGLVVSPRSF